MILTYNQIWEMALNKGYGSSELTLKDAAEHSVCCFAEENGMENPEKSDCYGDTIDHYCDTYGLLFDEHGDIVYHI